MLLFMGNTSNVWTNSSFKCFRDLCAASGGNHGYCGTEDINVLLLLLLEHSIDKGYLSKNDEVSIYDVYDNSILRELCFFMSCQIY